ncbi:hypothetical protein Pmar_PMAR006631 [Perkinsus marinus ATCC 50983]|uniref:Uncharacterized protein n=1 Tax=Perkinsus marinus (strain ATCC 50983 / TXsc) TaxID=423536 RepID=C5LLT7_PERM5|nr:hypothetical protein Pmar_PMAR006631 [Perkinsus marinus ATCC 50983]EER02309.1 hypothetical protein Pmar_PMAR006631 [Perkinsus marinus ATCC 50983]|eukprot:XP_002769591.1 hypothetical protein Pmar_PMAR006631 [Perkinsus marinus ATCC 50983]
MSINREDMNEVRFMHSLALNEEGILKKKEVDKIVDLRSKYARAEFAANTETTLALSTLQAEVVEYLSDLEIKIHHRKSDHPRVSHK